MYPKVLGFLLLPVLLGLAAAAKEVHWSFRPLNPGPLPEQCTDPWAKNAIDGFILKRLEHEAVRPQPEADRATLIRRVSAGLTGLPPSLEELELFTADDAPEAYRRMVDDFLARPAFGERWARHWLDVARFGETDGILTVNEDRPRETAWQYRDAVIRAFNADLPFDQFVSFQLAGAPKGMEPDYVDLHQFIHLGTRLQSNANPNDRQWHRLDDMVSTTGNAFLGLSFGCARCHDHPVDPMTTAEYYEFAAVFFDQVQENEKAKNKRVPLEITEPRILTKGSWSSPGDSVQAGYLQVLMRSPADHWQGKNTDQLASMAAWLTDVEAGAGMQLARVMVNRIWHHHVGAGLVKTPNDFGHLGAPPSHPELLDWLATELIKNDWKLKSVHRLILNSATYRQRGAHDPALLVRDAENTWLWQWRPQRLEAEALRDRLLQVAGVLKPEMYGPSISIGGYQREVPDAPHQWRRSIYLLVHRTVRHPTLCLFDRPDTSRSVGARSTGSTAEASLFALNAPLMWDLAGHFARRIVREAGEVPSDQIRHAYLLALSRPPTPEEAELGRSILKKSDDHDLVVFAHLLLSLNEFIYIH